VRDPTNALATVTIRGFVCPSRSGPIVGHLSGVLHQRLALVGDGLTRGTPGMAGTDNQASADTTGFRPRRVTSLLSPSAAAMNSLAQGQGPTPSGHSIALKRSVNAMRSALVSCSPVISALISDPRRLRRSSV
jgi:hypothetical protein